MASQRGNAYLSHEGKIVARWSIYKESEMMSTFMPHLPAPPPSQNYTGSSQTIFSMMETLGPDGGLQQNKVRHRNPRFVVEDKHLPPGTYFRFYTTTTKIVPSDDGKNQVVPRDDIRAETSFVFDHKGNKTLLSWRELVAGRTNGAN